MTSRTDRSAIPEVGVVTVAMNTFVELKKFSVVGNCLLAEGRSATTTATTTTTAFGGYGGKGVASRDLKRTP